MPGGIAAKSAGGVASNGVRSGLLASLGAAGVSRALASPLVGGDGGADGSGVGAAASALAAGIARSGRPASIGPMAPPSAAGAGAFVPQATPTTELNVMAKKNPALRRGLAGLTTVRLITAPLHATGGALFPIDASSPSWAQNLLYTSVNMPTHQRFAGPSLLACILGAIALAGCPPTKPPLAFDGGPPDAKASTAAADAADTGPVSPGPTPPPPGTPPATCASDPLSPKATNDPARPTVPWKFVYPSDRRPAGAACVPSGNQKPQLQSSLRCRGQASVRRSATTLELILGAGASLTWAAPANAPSVAPPAVRDGDQVFVDFVIEAFQVCPFCGGYQGRELEIRDRDGGILLWVGREGQKQSDLDEATVLDIFGVTARTRAACTQSFEAGCLTAERQQFDHILATSPEQVLRHGRLERVRTPKGSFEVLWAASAEVTREKPNCADGPAVAHDTGFAASLIP